MTISEALEITRAKALNEEPYEIALGSVQALTIVLEWPDFEKRFSYREAGRRGPAFESDLLNSVAAAVARVESASERAADAFSVAGG